MLRVMTTANIHWHWWVFAVASCGGLWPIFASAQEGRFLAQTDPRVTFNGCVCKKSWDETGIGKCDDYCCNPDNDPTGPWCKVEDLACEDSDWGYCDPDPYGTPAPTKFGETQCSDTPRWADTDGDGCFDYADSLWCTKDGKVGSGWHEEWGELTSFVANGYSALQACCACGGGSQNGASIIPLQASTAQTGGTRYTYSGCKCRDGWDESDFFNGQVSCSSACCNPDDDPAGLWCLVEDPACEEAEWGYCRPPGGSGDSTVPTMAGTDLEKHGHCTDTHAWSDADGETCANYASNAYCTEVGGYGLGWNMQWGTFWNYASPDLDMDATDACCACGGGSMDQFAYYYMANYYYDFTDPESWPSQTWNGCACKQKWKEKNLPKCDNYCCNPNDDFQGLWCYVEDPKCEDADWGYCQTNGLGTVPRPLQDAAHCSDVQGLSLAPWLDKDGDSCSMYSRSMWCTAIGGKGSGWHDSWGTFDSFAANGHTAATACCACGGGVRKSPAQETMLQHGMSSMNELFKRGSKRMWKVVSGPCVMDEDDGCITSGNFPNRYGSGEQCQIAINAAQAKPIHVFQFDTELTYDVLLVNGDMYSGRQGPQGIIPEGTIHWGADGEDEKGGWKMCPRDEVAQANPVAQVLKVIGSMFLLLLACCCCVIIGLFIRHERNKPHGDGLGAGPIKVGRTYASQEDER